MAKIISSRKYPIDEPRRIISLPLYYGSSSPPWRGRLSSYVQNHHHPIRNWLYTQLIQWRHQGCLCSPRLFKLQVTGTSAHWFATQFYVENGNHNCLSQSPSYGMEQSMTCELSLSSRTLRDLCANWNVVAGMDAMVTATQSSARGRIDIAAPLCLVNTTFWYP